MNCYYVFVRGQLQWHAPPPASEDGHVFQPMGFYCHRFVLASTPQSAQATVFARVRKNLDKDGWLTKNAVALTLEVDEIETAPVYKLLKPENRGHTFYSG